MRQRLALHHDAASTSLWRPERAAGPVDLAGRGAVTARSLLRTRPRARLVFDARWDGESTGAIDELFRTPTAGSPRARQQLFLN